MYRGILAALLLMRAGLSAAAKPVPCPPGRYVITQGAAIVVGDSAPVPGTVVVQGSQIGLGAHCPLRNGSVRATRKGTRIKGEWPSCGTLRGVKLSGLVETDCQTMTGTVRARKTKPQTFQARLSTCGDQVIDPGSDEQCDGGVGCAAGEECTADCRCEPPPVTTTTLASLPTTTTNTSPITTTSTSTTTSTTLSGIVCPQAAIVKATVTLVPATDGSTASSFAGIKVNLAYPAAVSLPGSGALPVGDPGDPATRELLLDPALYAGLVIFNDTNAALVTTLALSTPEPLSGPLRFEEARFDCMPGTRIVAGDFGCTVVDEADQLGGVIPPSARPACRVALSP